MNEESELISSQRSCADEGCYTFLAKDPGGNKFTSYVMGDNIQDDLMGLT
ncbi:hypothetical protein LOAG_09071 [Loa loa]|uniref:Glyoxalase n=1 Tax=Loa loa TaxID=7209 RepID=A0A1I7VLM8_LOALO|nr:hypothetical protein LOAG_09071 [Loa loa]EFO19422.2 hypothetical protein LOAG_09071 [Loa loa]